MRQRQSIKPVYVVGTGQNILSINMGSNTHCQIQGEVTVERGYAPSLGNLGWIEPPPLVAAGEELGRAGEVETHLFHANEILRG
jgi:hypothetical protein